MPSTKLTAMRMIWSATRKNTEAIATITNTMAVVMATPSNLTLPTVIWSTWYTGQIGQATAMSLVFMLLFLPLALVYLLGRRGPRAIGGETRF